MLLNASLWLSLSYDLFLFKEESFYYSPQNGMLRQNEFFITVRMIFIFKWESVAFNAHFMRDIFRNTLVTSIHSNSLFFSDFKHHCVCSLSPAGEEKRLLWYVRANQKIQPRSIKSNDPLTNKNLSRLSC